MLKKYPYVHIFRCWKTHPHGPHIPVCEIYRVPPPGHKQTTNVGVLLELGRETLDIECIKFVIKIWERIKGGNTNKLIVDSYNSALGEGMPWVMGAYEYLATNGLHNLPSNSSGKPFIYEKLYNVLTKKLRVDAPSSIGGPGHKLPYSL